MHRQQKLGLITDLQEQVRFELIPKQYHPGGLLAERECAYVADFVYLTKWGKRVIEDCKGFRTPLYIAKRKMMRYNLGIEVIEI